MTKRRELLYQEILTIRLALENFAASEDGAERKQEIESLQWALKEATLVVLEVKE